ncbi:membrane metallo-endopeptidase-like 1 [Aplysia californica]|uniref:Membrane metallo-endopeptidase-like 1 n=1 Tax=Aplysia californica TaxID=6500 RepID=A0ABM0ZUI3_APLCA|nr:membrane metallo-endopeptidase-like 1 [Aplysia californica]
MAMAKHSHFAAEDIAPLHRPGILTFIQNCLSEKSNKNNMSGGVKALLFVLVLALVAVVVLAVVIVQIRDDNKDTMKETSDKNKGDKIDEEKPPKTSDEICLTPTCITAAARILKNVDASVHPCDDFYKFACGGWLKNNEIPEDRSYYDVFSEVAADVNRKVKRILEEPPASDDLQAVTSARNLYQSCLDLDTMNNRGDQHFKDWLKANIGDSPLISTSWNEATFDLTDVVINATKQGSSLLVGIYPDVDDKNSSVHIMKIDQPGLGMPGQKYYLVPRNDTMLMAYQTFIYRVAETMGFADPATAQQDVEDIVDFEVQLAQVRIIRYLRRDAEALYNPMTLAEVHGNYSTGEFDFMRFVTSLLTAPEIGITDFTENETIINISPSYFRNFTELIRNTPKRTIANYVYWRVTMGFLGSLTQEYKDHRFEYYKVVYGVKTEEARDKMCSRYTRYQTGFAIGKIFVERHFEPEAKAMALEMIAGLQSAFDELVNELSWMDAETKRLAQEKNEVIQSKIGYPEFVRNDTYLEELYSNLTFTSDQYFENNLMIMKEGYGSWMRVLRKPVDTDAWFMSPATVNAYYYAINNEIAFPAGILQPPFFSKDFPKSLNFGGIGMVIGHEITHGFDDRGRQYDKNGNLEQWWSDSVIQNFKDKAQCIVDQYGAYVMEEADMNLNGINTQGENIADNGGLKQAFRAYRNWVNARGKEEPILPGLPYSNDQLFFINQAQVWCNLERRESVIQLIRSGVHSPGQYRVIGPNQNSEDFSRVFSCPKTSFMNAEKKCQVW